MIFCVFGVFGILPLPDQPSFKGLTRTTSLLTATRKVVAYDTMVDAVSNFSAPFSEPLCQAISSR
jgi:hypothetical protein